MTDFVFFILVCGLIVIAAVAIEVVYGRNWDD